MSDQFTHYAEPHIVLSDAGRTIVTSLGEVGGMTLAYLGVNEQDVLLTLPELRKLIEHLGYCDPDVDQRTRGYYLYRVEYTGYPDGAWWEDGEYGGIDPDWTPEGWEPDDDYISRFGGSRFHWPSVKHEYRSLSSAKVRAKLIESYGATTRIVQSSLITWPAPEPAIEEVW